MKKNISTIFFLISLFLAFETSAQNRISYNSQNLFLNGSNLAWVSFAHDVGLGTTDTASIGEWMIQMHQSGGNALRVWLHTNGTASPVFDANNYVIGPGEKTIADIKKILDLGWQREISVDLCLWSFDMLQTSLGADTIARNVLLLTDTSYTNAYIKNCLIPMVKALKGHPAIVTWEIFNEPEGMTTEFGWTGRRVPMSAVQRFVNLCAGAIHREDPTAKVTNGAQTFNTVTDVLAKVSPDQGFNIAAMSASEKTDLENWFNRKYRVTFTAEQIVPILKKIAAANHNYYSDERLIAAGGDQQGTLDFYSVHYYYQNGAGLSPLTHTASHWNLTKPIVIGEFAMKVTDSVPVKQLYDTLFANGYAGAFSWSWSDANFSSHDDMLAGMQSVWDNHRVDVDILGAGGDWPKISLTSPQDGEVFATGSSVTISADATDDEGATITSVDFFVSDTIKIGTATSSPYTYIWANPDPGIYKLKAVATNSLGHIRTSLNPVQITIGTPPMTRLEAEKATRHSTSITVKTDKTASGGSYVDCATNDTTATLTWQFDNLAAAGDYPVTFGFRLAYDSPKTQFLNVNGVRVGTVLFEGASISTWYEKTVTVPLVPGSNTIQIAMSWGWMNFDYLAVPTSIVTDVEELAGVPKSFSLMQNYPNPFNPTTVISYELPKSSRVSLKVYDVLGREDATLVNEEKTAGSYKVELNGRQLSSGVYFYRLNAGDFVQTKKMLLMK